MHKHCKTKAWFRKKLFQYSKIDGKDRNNIFLLSKICPKQIQSFAAAN